MIGLRNGFRAACIVMTTAFLWAPAAAGQSPDDPRTIVTTSHRDVNYLMYAADWFYPENRIANDVHIGFDGTDWLFTDRAAGIDLRAGCTWVDELTVRCPDEWTHSVYVSTAEADDLLDAREARADGGWLGFDLGPGDDRLLGAPDVVGGTGGPGNDLLKLGPGRATGVGGGDGDDAISAGDGMHDLRGDGGTDAIVAGPGRDFLDCCGGDRGDDYLVGGAGDDELNAKRGADVARGGPGDDSLDGTGDHGAVDILDCGPGNDEVAPGPGDVALANCELFSQVVGCDFYPGCVSTVVLVGRAAGRRVVLARNKARHYDQAVVSLSVHRRALRRVLGKAGRARLTAVIESRSMGFPRTHRRTRGYAVARPRGVAKAMSRHPAAQRLSAVRSTG